MTAHNESASFPSASERLLHSAAPGIETPSGAGASTARPDDPVPLYSRIVRRLLGSRGDGRSARLPAGVSPPTLLLARSSRRLRKRGAATSGGSPSSIHCARPDGLSFVRAMLLFGTELDPAEYALGDEPCCDINDG